MGGLLTSVTTAHAAEAALGALPSVQVAAVVHVARDGREDVLAACVVPAQATRPADLRGALAGTLAAQDIPSLMVVVPALPRLPGGGVDREAVAAFLAAQSAEHQPVPPRDDVERRLHGIWSELLGNPAIGVTDDFFALGGHSLLAGRMLVAVEERMGRAFPPAVFADASTIESLAALIRGEAPLSRAQRSRADLARSGEPPLFLAYSLRGTSLQYRALIETLDRPAYALEAPWWDGRRPAERSIEALAARHAREIRSIQPRGPYRLGGFSFGGVLAWAIAQVLTAEGEEVLPVLLIDTTMLLGGAAPRFPRHAVPGPPPEAGRVTAIRDFLELARHSPFRATVENLAVLLGWADALDQVLSEVDLWRRGSVRASRRAPYVWRQLTGIALRYAVTPGPGRVVLLRAAADPRPRRDLGWGRIALGGVEIREVPGGHDDLLVHPVVSAVGAAIRDVLDSESRD